MLDTVIILGIYKQSQGNSEVAPRQKHSGHCGVDEPLNVFDNNIVLVLVVACLEIHQILMKKKKHC